MDSEEFTFIGRHPFEIWVNGGVRDDSLNARPGTSLETLKATSIVQKANKGVYSLSYAERGMLVELAHPNLR